jgi:hypothetical protein
MAGLTEETLIGYNKFIDDQKAEPGECRITLIQFALAGDYKATYTAADVKTLAKLTKESYCANGGGTALIDSFVSAIEQTGARLAAMKESDRPEKVIFLAITDGLENASHRCTKAQLKEKITHQTNNYNWQFIYQGANQDAIAEAQSYGIAANKAMTFGATAAGMISNCSSASTLTRKLRSSTSGDLAQVGYTEQERADNSKHVASTP